jgi:hypothetical protein
MHAASTEGCNILETVERKDFVDQSGTVKPPDRFTGGSRKNPERRHRHQHAGGKQYVAGPGRLRHARPSTRHRAGAAEAAGARRSSAKTVNRLLTTFVGSA